MKLHTGLHIIDSRLQNLFNSNANHNLSEFKGESHKDRSSFINNQLNSTEKSLIFLILTFF